MPRYYTELLGSLAAHYGVSLDTPWRDLPARARDGILHGAGAQEIEFRVARKGAQAAFKRRWDGVLGELARRYEAAAELEKDELARYRSETPCPACGGHAAAPRGARREASRGASIADLCRLPVGEVARFLETLELGPARSARSPTACSRRSAIASRFLPTSGLDYLTLDRRQRHALGRRGRSASGSRRRSARA